MVVENCPATGLAADDCAGRACFMKMAIGMLLEVADGQSRLVPLVKSQYDPVVLNYMVQQQLIDGHIAGAGQWRIDNQL